MNLNRIVSSALLPLLLAATGCMSVDYLGETLSPTTHVDLFYDEADVPSDCREMGKMIVRAGDFVSSDDMRARIIEEARNRGADAVLIGTFERVAVGNRQSGWVHSDDRFSSSSTLETNREVIAMLLKYGDKQDHATSAEDSPKVEVATR